ncbi:MAG: hypothetical protein ACRYG8_38745, partial [Janthinobacterium lividum]
GGWTYSISRPDRQQERPPRPVQTRPDQSVLLMALARDWGVGLLIGELVPIAGATWPIVARKPSGTVLRAV